MGSRGPQPKPSYLRLLEGNPGHRPFNPAESKVPIVQHIEPPSWLSAESKLIWVEVCRELAAMNGLSTVDYQMLILYVDTLAEIKRLILKLQTLPDTAIPKKGYGPDGKTLITTSVKSLPWYSQLIAQKNLALKFATHFGMTPSARARIVFLGNDVTKDQDDDPFA